MKQVFVIFFVFCSVPCFAQPDGPSVGSKLRSLAGQDMITGKVIDIEFANSPAYTLFHFWQNNCDTCIRQFTVLYKFVAQHKNKLIAYGFPYETKQQIPAAKELINRYKLNWPQLLQYKQTNAAGANVIDVLMIKEFPTYLLLDRDGVILVRSNHLGDVEALLVKMK